MAKSLEDIGYFPDAFSKPFHREWSAEIPIGASGATGTILQGPPGLTVAKNGTGTYDCTNLPPWPASAGKGRWKFGLYSPASTVGSAIVTAYNATNGTMTFKTVVGVTATEPANGDIIWLYFEGECR